MYYFMISDIFYKVRSIRRRAERDYLKETPKRFPVKKYKKALSYEVLKYLNIILPVCDTDTLIFMEIIPAARHTCTAS